MYVKARQASIASFVEDIVVIPSDWIASIL